MRCDKRLTSEEMSSCRCCTDEAGHQNDGQDDGSDARDVEMRDRNVGIRRGRDFRSHYWPLQNPVT
jgi:hypothetical protein